MDGVPIFNDYSVDRTFVLAANRRCALCGFEMPEGTHVYRAFGQADAANIRLHERDHSHDLAGPLHYSCIVYSAMACPYLKEKGSRLAKDSKINPGERRGTRAAILGFQNLGVMLYAGPPDDRAAMELSFPMIAYIGLEDDIPYMNGSDLAERYPAAVERDRKIIDMSQPRMYWTDSSDDAARLRTAMKQAASHLKRQDPIHGPLMVGIPDNPAAARGPYLTMPV